MARELVKTITDRRKNYIINGDMAIAQRGTSFAAIANNTYFLDRYVYSKVGAMIHTASQDTDVPTQAQAGYLFQNSLRLNLTTPDTSIAAGDRTDIQYRVEGYDWVNLAQKSFTLSFWAKATLTGTYCIGFRNSGTDRSYVAEYTINASNTWEKKTITVAASPSDGSWNYTNGVGLYISFTVAAGTSFHTTAGSWQTGSFIATSNQVNGTNTGATDFRITGVMLNEGATTAPFSLFGDNFEGEVSACRRYYEKSYPINQNPGTAENNAWSGVWIPVNGSAANSLTGIGTRFSIQKRSTPTMAIYDGAGNGGNVGNFRIGVRNNAGGQTNNITPTSVTFTSTGVFVYHTVATSNSGIEFHWVADAEL